MPQIAADLLGLPIETFRYVQADTAEVRAGNGHGGARSMHMGGAALCKAVDAMIAKGTAVAARLLQAEPQGYRFAEGRFSVHGEPARAMALLDVARAACDPANLPDGAEPGLDTYVWNLLDVITFPNGCHIAEVEVDPDTGAVTLDRYTAVDDFGTLINPMLTMGQVQGGLAQGIGQAMLEHTVYDPRFRPVAERVADGLRAPARRRPARPRHHADRHADQRQSARRQRRGPGGRDGRAANHHLRGAGRACSAWSDPYRHARDPGTSLARYTAAHGRPRDAKGQRKGGHGQETKR